MKKSIMLMFGMAFYLSPAQTTTTITQNQDQTVQSNPYSICLLSDPENPSFVSPGYTKLSRSFDLKSFGITSDFTVTKVSFGANFDAGTDVFPFTLRLATSGAPYPGGTLTELHNQQVSITAGEKGTLKDFVLSAPVLVPAGSELVMSFENGGGFNKPIWNAASNLGAQKAPTYITAPECGKSSPTILKMPFGEFTPISVLMSITGFSQSLGTVELNSKTLSVYPNPATDVVNVSVKDGIAESIEIVNMAGQSIYSAKAAKSVNVSSLPAGVYVVKVKANGITYVEKLIKK
jgi:hypothetical protein